MAAWVGSGRAFASGRAYVLRVLPLGMARGLVGTCRGERGAARRTLAIAVGLTMTTAGYTWGQYDALVTRAASEPAL